MSADVVTLAPGHGPTRRRSIEAVLAGARSRLRRLTPLEAVAAQQAGAVVVDIRPHAQRQAEGGPEGVLVIERNVLEWRFDPASDARLPVADYDLQVVVLCQEGYTSSLAAAALQDLGVWRATDVVGGWRDWRAAVAEPAPDGDQRERSAIRSAAASRSAPR